MSTMDDADAEYFVEVLEFVGRVAREAWMPDGTPWEELDRNTRITWCRVADAVLGTYDPEWVHDKAVQGRTK